MVKDDETQNFTLTYGEKGFIYKQVASIFADGKELNATLVLKATSLIAE